MQFEFQGKLFSLNEIPKSLNELWEKNEKEFGIKREKYMMRSIGTSCVVFDEKEYQELLETEKDSPLRLQIIENPNVLNSIQTSPSQSSENKLHQCHETSSLTDQKFDEIVQRTKPRSSPQSDQAGNWISGRDLSDGRQGDEIKSSEGHEKSLRKKKKKNALQNQTFEVQKTQSDQKLLDVLEGGKKFIEKLSKNFTANLKQRDVREIIVESRELLSQLLEPWSPNQEQIISCTLKKIKFAKKLDDLEMESEEALKKQLVDDLSKENMKGIGWNLELAEVFSKLQMVICLKSQDEEITKRYNQNRLFNALEVTFDYEIREQCKQIMFIIYESKIETQKIADKMKFFNQMKTHSEIPKEFQNYIWDSMQKSCQKQLQKIFSVAFSKLFPSNERPADTDRSSFIDLYKKSNELNDLFSVDEKFFKVDVIIEDLFEELKIKIKNQKLFGEQFLTLALLRDHMLENEQMIKIIDEMISFVKKLCK